MHSLANLFASDTGQFMAGLLIVLGLSNTFLPYLVFTKQIRHHHGKITPELAAEERTAVESQIKQLRLIQRCVIGVGLALVILGAIGLASTKGA